MRKVYVSKSWGRFYFTVIDQGASGFLFFKAINGMATVRLWRYRLTLPYRPAKRGGRTSIGPLQVDNSNFAEGSSNG